MDRKSIGILTYYWPPSGGSGVQRWLRFSNHLAELGWEVHVFTFKNPQFEVIDNDTKSALKKIKDIMTSVKDSDLHSFSIPLSVDVNIGDNWGELH